MVGVLQTMLLGCVLAGVAGCFNYRVGADPRPAPAVLAEDTWPARDPDRLSYLASLTSEGAYDLLGVLDEVQEPEFTILGSLMTVGGLLRVYESHAQRETIGDFFENYFYGFERNATFISSYWYDRFGEAAIEAERERMQGFMAALRESRPDATLNRPTASEILLVGANISLGVPTTAAGERGILVHLPALVGNEYEQGVIERFERDGWTVLHVESDTSIRGPGYLQRRDARRERRRRQSELVLESDVAAADIEAARQGRTLSRSERREYEAALINAMKQAAAEIPMPDMGFEIRDGADLDALGATIATYVDEHLADHAYATEAAIRYLDETLPDLADKPIVIVGFSAGSLAAPTVAARLREQFPSRLRAMVLVGSGAPIFDVARLSSLTDGGLSFSPEDGPEPADHEIDALREHYLRYTKLDPWVTGAAIADLPILHVYASDDTIVPSVAARALNERLGRPDRLVYSGGHLGLFFFLPKQRERMSRWIIEHTHE